jgi:hypothetical protein
MSKMKIMAALLFAAGVNGQAHAGLVLDSGTPDNSRPPLSLDGSDYYAAEFTLGGGQTITGIQGYINGGDSGFAGDTFTISIYANNPVANLPQLSGGPLFSQQAVYQTDGWNGVNSLSETLSGAGQYWVAFEVGASDSTAGLLMPIVAANGSAPALKYAFNDGTGYRAMTGENFGVQVSAVPLPPALLLFASGVLGLGGSLRRRQA